MPHSFHEPGHPAACLRWSKTATAFLCNLSAAEICVHVYVELPVCTQLSVACADNAKLIRITVQVLKIFAVFYMNHFI